MRVRPAILAVLLLGLSSTTIPAAAEPELEDPHVFQASFPLRTQSSEETNTTYTCGGQAPFKPVCTTGTHVREGSSFKLSVTAANYEGVLENRLEYDGGSVVLRCVIDGASGDCELITIGEPARPGIRVVHLCSSENRGNGLPGGSGSWSCSFVD